MKTTIQAQVKFLTETNPNKEVFVFVSATGVRTTLTCREIYELSSKFGSLLRKAGIKQGDVVCDTLPNSPETVICDFGILAAGGVILNKTAYRSWNKSTINFCKEMDNHLLREILFFKSK